MLFESRKNFKPFEYPEAEGYKEAIQNSYWLVTDNDFTADIHDFMINLSDQERNAVKNSLLAISQIEVSVKKFWARIGDHIPKPEIDQVGIVFGESEVRHSDAYSALIKFLGLNDEFNTLLDNPLIQGRVDYLTKYLKNTAENKQQGFALSLALFSIFIENVSLFSQFLVIKSFFKYKALLKSIDNVVESTQKEETVHALFGIYLINKMKEEYPEYFNEDFYVKIERACKKAYEAECKIIDWIFEKGDLTFLTKEEVKQFIAERFNQSLVQINAKPVFEINKEVIDKFKWFEEELKGGVLTDFFHKVDTNYTRRQKPITSEDLF
jgi:ribonucleoside-diphosphate reductase beta chain